MHKCTTETKSIKIDLAKINIQTGVLPKPLIYLLICLFSRDNTQQKRKKKKKNNRPRRFMTEKPVGVGGRKTKFNHDTCST